VDKKKKRKLVLVLQKEKGFLKKYTLLYVNHVSGVLHILRLTQEEEILFPQSVLYALKAI
jgi:hypothetical protein